MRVRTRNRVKRAVPSTDITIIRKDTLINLSLATHVVVVKVFGKLDPQPRLHYLSEDGTWTANPAAASKFANFRSALEAQRLTRGDDVCLRK